jgi:outer membrane protein assembly factor BamB
MKLRTVLCLLALPAVLGSICCRSGRIAWRWTLSGRCYAAPLVEGREVYVVTQAGEVVAGELATGKRLWQARLPDEFVSEPAMDRDRIYVAGRQGGIFAVSRKDGKLVWETRPPGDFFEAPLTIAAGLVFAPSARGTVYALESSNGAVRWSTAGERRYSTGAVVRGNNLFIGGWSNRFSCMDLNGRILWRFSPGTGGAVVRDAVLRKNQVFFASRDNHVYSLDAPTGRLLWRYSADYPSNLLLWKDRLLFTDQKGAVILLDPDSGTQVRRFDVHLSLQPIYLHGSGCLAISDKIYEIDPTEGTSVEFFSPRTGRPLVLATSPMGLIVSTTGNSIVAFF